MVTIAIVLATLLVTGLYVRRHPPGPSRTRAAAVGIGILIVGLATLTLLVSLDNRGATKIGERSNAENACRAEYRFRLDVADAHAVDLAETLAQHTNRGFVAAIRKDTRTLDREIEQGAAIDGALTKARGQRTRYADSLERLLDAYRSDRPRFQTMCKAVGIPIG